MSVLLPSKFPAKKKARIFSEIISFIRELSPCFSLVNTRLGRCEILAGLIFTIGGLSVNAESVTYTSFYEASHLPENSSPQWAYNGDKEAIVHLSDEGKLEVSTLGASALMSYWALGNFEDSVLGTASEWNTHSGTIDLKVRIDSTISSEDPEGAQGFWIQISDQSGRCWNFFIGRSAIYFTDIVTGQRSEVDTESIGLDTGVFNTYRIAIDSGVASLYVNHSSEPIFSRIPGVQISGRTALMFGDSSSFQSSSYVLESIRWSNVIAEFSAPL